MKTKCGRLRKMLSAALGAVILCSLAGCGEKTDKQSSASGSDGDSQISAVKKNDYLFDDEEFVSALKDRIAEEATDGKVTLLVKDDDLTRISGTNKGETITQKFVEMLSDSRYELFVAVLGGNNYGEYKKISGGVIQPDVVAVTNDEGVDNYMTNGEIAPVSEEYIDSVISQNTEDSVKSSTVDGVLYSFPNGVFNGFTLVYDKRVLSDEDVRDMDTVVERCADAGKQFYVNYRGPFGQYLLITGDFKAAGEYDFKSPIFNTKEGMDIAEAAWNVARLGNALAYGSEGSVRAARENFGDGSCGAALIYPDEELREILGEENYGVAVMPMVTMCGEKRHLLSIGRDFMLAVSSKTKYPAAAQALAYYLTNSELQMLYYKSAGYFPVNKAARAQLDPMLINVSDAQRQYRVKSKDTILSLALNGHNYADEFINDVIYPASWPAANWTERPYLESCCDRMQAIDDEIARDEQIVRTQKAQEEYQRKKEEAEKR